MAQLPSSVQLNAVSLPGRRTGCKAGSWKGVTGSGGRGGRGGEAGRGLLSLESRAWHWWLSGVASFQMLTSFFSEDYDPASCTAKKKQLGVSLEVLKATELCVLACLKG